MGFKLLKNSQVYIRVNALSSDLLIAREVLSFEKQVY